MLNLRLLTLGGVRVHLDERDITAQIPVKALGLLVYLVRHQKPKSREHLAELFWPERRAEQAYGSLRTALSKTRAVIGDALQAGHQEVSIRGWLDANDFELSLQNPATVGDALALYQGDFLAGFFAGDAREFEHWQLREAEALHERFIRTSLQYIHTLRASARFEDAILSARHALKHAALSEDLHRVLIQLYHITGQRAAALQQYDTCRHLLWEEFGLEPDETTQALLKQIRHLPALSSSVATERHRLPARITSFVGRVDALQKIEALLQRCNLLTITATGGMGKTRQVLEAAHRLKDHFADGVYFVDLTKISDVKDILSLIMSTIGLTEDSSQDPLAQIQHYLHDREMLLILDNFEHVIEAANLIAHIISDAPQLRVLVTSREPLKLYGEQLFRLAPLSLDESCQLFRERIRAVDAEFHRTETSDAQVEAICRHLEGLPLAIELAAMRFRNMSLEEILDGLTAQLDVLTSDLRGVPKRQRTLFHTIDWSYALLTPEQATLFRQLAVFRGGWTHQALTHTSACADVLPDLVDKNLVKRSLSGIQRYTMLETIREYALYQLRQHDEEASAQAAHAEWVLGFAEAAERDLRTDRQPEAVARIKDEQDNIRVALDYLAHRPDKLEVYARIISALSWYWNFQQFNQLPFEHARHAIQHTHDLPSSVRARLLLAGGHSAHGLSRYDLADSWQNEALHIFESIGDTHNAAFVKAFMSPRLESETLMRDTLLTLREYALKQDDAFLLCVIDLNLGYTLCVLQDYEQAQTVLQEGLAICERQNNLLALPFFYINLSNIYAASKLTSDAFTLLERAWVLAQTEGNRFTEVAALLELAELLSDAERWHDAKYYLTKAEEPLHELNNPELYVRFYCQMCMLAFAETDPAGLQANYSLYLRYAVPGVLNHWSSLAHILMRFALMQAQNGDPQTAARILGGLDAYSHKFNVAYPQLVDSWRNQITQLININPANQSLQLAVQAGAQVTIQEMLIIVQDIISD